MPGGAGGARVKVYAPGGLRAVLGVFLGIEETDLVAVDADEVGGVVGQAAHRGVAAGPFAVLDLVAGLEAMVGAEVDGFAGGGGVDDARRGRVEVDERLHRAAVGDGDGVGVVFRGDGELAAGDARLGARLVGRHGACAERDGAVRLQVALGARRGVVDADSERERDAYAGLARLGVAFRHGDDRALVRGADV